MAKKKAKNKTKEKSKLILIVDRSSSMCGIASDMEGAMKEVLDTQKKEYDGEMFVTLIRFDDDYEEVFFDKPLNEVEEIKLEPRGCTALLDAIGRTINKVERTFIETDEKDRPEKILFIIITDGQENASKEFTRADVFKIIETVKRDREWDFTFIGANQDSIREGGNIGIRGDKSLNFVASAAGVRKMSKSVSDYTTSYFRDKKASYSQEDRGDLK